MSGCPVENDGFVPAGEFCGLRGDTSGGGRLSIEALLTSVSWLPSLMSVFYVALYLRFDNTMP